MSECEKCGCNYKLSKRDSLMRKMVELNARMFPALQTIVDEAKDYCNLCWKARVKPAAETMAGVKSIE